MSATGAVSSGAVSSTGDSQGSGSGMIRIGVLLLIAMAVVVMVISQSNPGRRPFDLDSNAVDGYAAIRILLQERGVTAAQVRANDKRLDTLGVGSILVVPDPDLATDAQLKNFVRAAERGATVVFGSAPTITDGPDAEDVSPWSELGPGKRELADTSIMDRQPGICDIAELADLGRIDVAFSNDLAKTALSFVPENSRVGAQSSCYGTPDNAQFMAVRVAAPGSTVQGNIVVMASPYLWVNARLHPAKESGGPVPDNAATAVRLLHVSGQGGTSTVTFVEAVRTSPTAAGAATHPVELLPFGVKLALLQLLAAFGVFVWWRSRRLGAALVEPLPVEIAGSELISAMGRLRYRRNDISRAAGILRASMRRTLGMSLGVPQSAPFETLVDIVAYRTGRSHDTVRELLGDGPVGDREALVTLSHELESLRLESLDVYDR